MTLEYLRECRTYLQIAGSYDVSESSAFKTIRWVEDNLIRCGLFSLPGKKVLHKSDTEYDVVLIDATETPLERPQKNSEDTIPGRKRDIR